MANDNNSRIEKLEDKVSKLEEKLNNNIQAQCTLRADDKLALFKLITEAVEKGNKQILEKLEEHEKRIIALENQDGKKALLMIKTAFGTALTTIVAGIITHFIEW